MTLTVPMRDAAGRLLNLANLTPADIDFPAIAAALARQNRYAGNTSVPINVAQHTMIAAECAALRGNHAAVPYVLLHDAHEAFIGDITTPAQGFLIAVGKFLEPKAGAVLDTMFHHAKYVLDAIIFRAAGLIDEMPRGFYRNVHALTPCHVHAAVVQAGRDAYLIELRDFHRCMKPGDPDYGPIIAMNKIMPRPQKSLSIADAEMMLLAAWRTHLPCFTGKRAEDASCKNQ